LIRRIDNLWISIGFLDNDEALPKPVEMSAEVIQGVIALLTIP